MKGRGSERRLGRRDGDVERKKEGTEKQGWRKKKAKGKQNKPASCQIQSSCSSQTTEVAQPLFPNRSFLEHPRASQGTVIYYTSTMFHILQRHVQRGEISHFSSRQTFGKHFRGKSGFI